MLASYLNWNKIDYFGKATFFFRLAGYSFYSIYLLIFIFNFNIEFNIWYAVTILLAFLFPFLFLIDYYNNNNHKKILIKHFMIDFFMMGWYAGILQGSYLPASLFLMCAIANHIASLGYRKLINVLLFPLGYLCHLLIFGFQLNTTLTPLLIGLTILYTFIHIVALAYISYTVFRSLHYTKEKVTAQKSELSKQAKELQLLNDNLQILNVQLEEKVSSRTLELELKNAKLAEYAFVNGHHLRAPVATLLGLLQLLKYEFRAEERLIIIDKIRYEVNLLNVTVKEIRLRLETDELINKEMAEMEASQARSKQFYLEG